MTEKYLLKISYSWGDEESDEEFTTFDAAWNEAKRLALIETEECNANYEMEMGLYIDKEKGRIALHYTYDDEYCYYDVVKQ